MYIFNFLLDTLSVGWNLRHGMYRVRLEMIYMSDFCFISETLVIINYTF